VLRTTDGGKTFEVVAKGGLGGHSSGTLSRAQNGDYYIATQQQSVFLKSSDSGANWSLVTNSAKNCERAKYDSGHHLLFASCGANGFWRVVQCLAHPSHLLLGHGGERRRRADV